MTSASETLGIFAGILGLCVSAPQALRVRRQGTFGVSRATWMLMFAAYCCWLGYGIRTDSPSQILANGIALLIAGWLLIALLAGVKWKWPFLISVLVAGPSVILLVPEAAMSALLLAFEGVFIPQVYRSWQAWRQRTPIPAVSNLTWTVSLLSSSFWLAYAVTGQRPLVVATALVAISASSLILVFTRLANSTAGNARMGESPSPL